MLALELVAMKVDPDTRQKVKVLAAERGVEMWELVMELVEEEWRKSKQPPASKKQPNED
jgi:hypothetical protein